MKDRHCRGICRRSTVDTPRLSDVAGVLYATPKAMPVSGCRRCDTCGVVFLFRVPAASPSLCPCCSDRMRAVPRGTSELVVAGGGGGRGSGGRKPRRKITAPSPA